ncbi:MAG: hypothetical protein HY769_08985 [Candidatus Stahlbacteria bacterium]|nr:hypothetical protein [Candidatus Stahlbacteria bacterium]
MKYYQQKFVFIFLVIITMIATTSIYGLQINYQFEAPQIEKIEVRPSRRVGISAPLQQEEYHRISMLGTISYGRPGSPVMPIKAAKILLPVNEEIAEIEVIANGKTILEGTYKIEPGQLQVPISDHPTISPSDYIMPDTLIYNSTAAYPGNLYARAGTYSLCGYKIAHIYLYPIEYIPVTGQLAYYKELEIRIKTKPDLINRDFAGSRDPALPGTTAKKRVLKMVDNPEMIDSYLSSLSANRIQPIVAKRKSRLPRSGGGFGGTDTIDYIIITNEDLKSAFEELRQFKLRRGVKTEIATIETIYSQYPGTDSQEKIRNFIIDLYANKGLKYVLLGGDDEIIPHRGLYDIVNEGYPGNEYPEYDLPADVYYAGLDGNWDTDGDKIWGEPDEADLYTEVVVGRMACDSDSEVANFVKKTIAYQTTPIVAYCNKALMLGEDLHWTSWGREYKEEVRLGSNNWGYTTQGFPVYFNVDTLYDNPSYHWDKEALIPKFNAGVHLVNHLGHANPVYAMKMYLQDVGTRLTNPFYFIIHSQGCYTAAFDNRDSDGSYIPVDCIAEEFTTISSGAVAFIGNSRYGWGESDNTNGTSQRLDREFFNAIFGEGIYAIGEALQDAKEDAVPFVDSIDALRWCYYNLTLLGDPQLEVWTETPKILTATYPETVFIGTDTVAIKVTNGTTPIESAKVCLIMDSTIYAFCYTNATGEAYFILSPVNVGTMEINIHSHNYLPYQGNAIVIAKTTPYVVYYKSIIDDDNIGQSNGNGDFLLNPGETIELPIWSRNLGTRQARKVYGKLKSFDPYSIIQEDSGYFGNIAAMDSSLAYNYLFTVANNCPDTHLPNIELKCYDSSGTCWISYPQLKVYSPILNYYSHIIDDNNATLDPGETVSLSVGIKNIGSATATNIQTVLRTTDSFITILDSTAQYPDILPDSIRNNLIDYRITASANTPKHHIANFSVAMTASGYSETVNFMLKVAQGGDFIVFDPDPNHSSGYIIYDALLSNGFWGNYTQDLTQIYSYIHEYKVIFVSLGIWFCNYVLTDEAIVDSLCSYLNYGGNLFLEGGNFWFGDTLTKLRPYFHIEGVAQGSSDLDTIIGISGTFTQEMKFKYKGESKSIDRIKTDTGAWNIFYNRPAIYDNAIAFRSGKYNTIGTTFELGKLTEMDETLKLERSPAYCGINSNPDPAGDKTNICRLVDSIMKWFLKKVEHDVAVWSIDNIPDIIEPNIPINPKATIKNIGKYTESFNAICFIESLGCQIYADTELVNSLIPDSMTQIAFALWTPYENTQYKVKIRVSIVDDEPANNVRETYTLTNYAKEEAKEVVAIMLSYPIPNPMRRETIIKYSLPQKCYCELKIYNLCGQLIRTLINETQKEGYKTVIWDGKDKQGQKVKSGIYFYRLKVTPLLTSDLQPLSSVFICTRKLILMR